MFKKSIVNSTLILVSLIILCSACSSKGYKRVKYSGKKTGCYSHLDLQTKSGQAIGLEDAYMGCE